MKSEMKPKNVFILFDDDDYEIIQNIEKHCKPLVEQGKIDVWHHKKIDPGRLVETETKRKLEKADVILLMISSSLLNSERFYEVEKVSLERSHTGRSIVIPVYLKHCYFTGYDFTQLKMLPSDGEPVFNSESHVDLNKRYSEVAAEIHNLVDMLKQEDGENFAESPSLVPEQNGKNEAMAILFIINNPNESDPELLNEEINSIKTRILLGKCSCRYELIPKNVKTIEELQRAFLETRPRFVHFSGYATDDKRIVFLNSQNQKVFVSPESLKNLFDEFNEHLELVFLNSCFSDEQAPSISESVNYVIGIEGTVGEHASLDFVRGFYQAISYGTSIKKAFNLGRNLLQMKNELSFTRINMLEKALDQR